MDAITKREIGTILDSTHDGMIAVNASGTVTLFNRAAERITGLQADKVIGRPAVEAIPNTRLHIVLAPLSGPVLPLEKVIADAERGVIMRALQETRGNRTKAAGLLGISMRSLFYKIEKYGLKND